MEIARPAWVAFALCIFDPGGERFYLAGTHFDRSTRSSRQQEAVVLAERGVVDDVDVGGCGRSVVYDEASERERGRHPSENEKCAEQCEERSSVHSPAFPADHGLKSEEVPSREAKRPLC